MFFRRLVRTTFFNFSSGNKGKNKNFFLQKKQIGPKQSETLEDFEQENLIKNNDQIENMRSKKSKKSQIFKQQKPKPPLPPPPPQINKNKKITPEIKSNIQVKRIISHDWLNKNIKDKTINNVYQKQQRYRYLLNNNLLQDANNFILNNKLKLPFDYISICESILHEQINGNFGKTSSLKLITVQNIIKNIYNYQIEKLQQLQQQLEFNFDWFSSLIQKYNQKYIENPKSISSIKQSIDKLFYEILKNHLIIFSKNSLTQSIYLQYLELSYYGNQQKLQHFIDIISLFQYQSLKKMLVLLNQSLMMYKIKNKKNAFIVDQVLLKKYQQSFQLQSNQMLIICLLITKDCRELSIINHYLSYGRQVFQNLPQQISDKIIYQTYLNSQNLRNQKNLQILQYLQSCNKNSLMRVQFSIKILKEQQAYQNFMNQILSYVVIERQKKNLQFVLKMNYLQNSQSKFINYHHEQQINAFVNKLQPQYLFQLYLKRQSYMAKFQEKLPSQPYQFWRQTMRKSRAEQIFAWQSLGILEKVTTNEIKRGRPSLAKKQFRQQQEQLDFKISQLFQQQKQKSFNLKQYLKNQYPTQKKLLQDQHQLDKQMIKYILRVDSLIQDYISLPNATLNQNLRTYQKFLSQSNKQILQKAGLKDYDLVQYNWDQFVNRFRRFKRFNQAYKEPNIQKNLIIQKQEQQQWTPFVPPQLNQQAINNLYNDKKYLWQLAEEIVKLKPNDNVQKLILWGLYNQQPLAIYMGQKLAMVTGQIISDTLARRISDMLSYRRQINPQILKKCKEALAVVGRIQRQYIYDFNKDYHHILVRTNLHSYAQDLNMFKVKQPRLEHIEMITPFWKYRQEQYSSLIESAKKGPI